MVPRMTHQNPAEHACDAPGADDPLIRILADSPLCPSPSEAHGMLCGLVCGGASNPEDAWLAQLLPEAESGDLLQAEARAALSGITRQTLDELAGSELRLGLLLPDDSHPLAERATALYDWVRGFLYAWGTLESRQSEPSPQIREILDDFTAFTRMDLDRLDETEQNEEALTEVTEFVRVAALLIHQERVVARAAASRP